MTGDVILTENSHCLFCKAEMRKGEKALVVATSVYHPDYAVCKKNRPELIEARK